MEKMTEKRQRVLLKAIDKATDYKIEGMSGVDALAKSAEEYNLNPSEVVRVCEGYNKGNAIAYLSTMGVEKRASAHELIDAKAVVAKIYKPIEKTASEITFKTKDYRADYFRKPMAKTASVATKKPFARRGRSPLAAEALYADMEKYAGERELVTRELRDDVAKQKRIVMSSLNKIAGICMEKSPRQLNKIAENLTIAHGSSAKFLINAVNGKNNRYPNHYLPTVEKKAHAIFLPNEPIYKLATELLEATNAYGHALEKKAADEDQIIGGMADLVDTVTDPSRIKTPYKGDAIDAETGMNKEYDIISKEIGSRENLYGLMTDRDFTAYSPLELKKTYNHLIEAYPGLAKNKMYLKAVMKKVMAQGGDMDIYELKDLGAAHKDMATTRKEETASRSDVQKRSADSPAPTTVKGNTTSINIGGDLLGLGG